MIFFGRSKYGDVRAIDISTLAENLVGKDAKTIEGALLTLYIATSEGNRSGYYSDVKEFKMPDGTIKQRRYIMPDYGIPFDDSEIEACKQYGYNIPDMKRKAKGE